MRYAHQEFRVVLLANFAQDLLKVDLYRYDEKWEKEGSQVLRDYFHIDESEMNELFHRARRNSSCELPALSTAIRPKDDAAIIDLRQASDFNESKLPGSVSLPIAQAGAKSPFFDPSLLSDTWTRLENEFASPGNTLREAISGKRILVVCYDGDSARVAASVMRAKGYEVDSLRGGLDGLASMISSPKLPENDASQLPAPSWLQLCEVQHPSSHPAGETAAPANAKLLHSQQPTVRA